ncbi:hypothetical protein HPX95_15605 [Bacillus tequilensis]|uniref:hypothetical protein n=1 Tax=Bacillus tequilensis TaxID=227866 RepID=UPI0015760F11|nr:hypothetical protein [Bacillus tequilensis]NTU27589.1 hypothetical protein [Bacillus tequilensis]
MTKEGVVSRKSGENREKRTDFFGYKMITIQKDPFSQRQKTPFPKTILGGK